MIKEEEIKSCTPFDLYQVQVKSISPFFNRLVNSVANCVLKDGTALRTKLLVVYNTSRKLRIYQVDMFSHDKILFL